jgi:hypothetical protein
MLLAACSTGIAPVCLTASRLAMLLGFARVVDVHCRPAARNAADLRYFQVVNEAANTAALAATVQRLVEAGGVVEVDERRYVAPPSEGLHLVEPEPKWPTSVDARRNLRRIGTTGLRPARDTSGTAASRRARVDEAS